MSLFYVHAANIAKDNLQKKQAALNEKTCFLEIKSNFGIKIILSSVHYFEINLTYLISFAYQYP